MEYFNEDGHLTLEALTELIYGEPDDLARLEIAEHLSFCDECVSFYSNLLTDFVLIPPPEVQTFQIMRKIKIQAKKIFLNKYATVAIAAGFAMFLWTSGAFEFYAVYEKMENKILDQRQEQKYDFFDKLDQSRDQLFDGFKNWRGVIKNGKQ